MYTAEYLIIDQIKLPIYEDGEFVSPNSEKIRRIKIKEEVNQDILILDQENIPDGIYRISEGFVKIPIRNNTLNPLQVKNILEKYESIFEIREKEETALEQDRKSVV